MWFVGQTLCGSPDRPSLNVQKLKNWATLGKYFLLQKQHNLQRLQITVCNDCRLRFATIADYDLQRLQITICNDCRLQFATIADYTPLTIRYTGLDTPPQGRTRK